MLQREVIKSKGHFYLVMEETTSQQQTTSTHPHFSILYTNYSTLQGAQTYRSIRSAIARMLWWSSCSNSRILQLLHFCDFRVSTTLRIPAKLAVQ